MVQLKGRAELAKAVEPEEGKSYTIVGVEEVKTAVQGFNGIRVQLKSSNPKDDKQYATMLWMRETAGIRSKLGAFLDAFTNFLGDEDDALNTDNWLDHEIRIITWKPRAREIAVIK